MRVAGLLLAAGAGRRMGGPKALVPLDGEPLVARGLRALRGGGLDPRVVVLGAAAERAREVVAATDPGAVAVVAPDWADGMGASLRAGLAALASDVDAVLVLLVDTPGIGPEALARVAAAATRDGLARGSYDGRPGHPVLIGAAHLAGVAAAAHDDVGARGYLADRDDVHPVEVGDVATRDDVDTPADLARTSRQER
ncbi:nucleotidyltransferase family protein [Actinomycetospora endophytica]|uniref:Nucleotidyltransferase family protein n=1 Tax=Actinomycetospora endophytica TaxID=2291215 RepID=A0ABS8P7A8_9PSEU|nr:nucleotidyltransferase family protein [Actinomycetospora endophytica]MCD2194147.1 nucleotidyltransferase family protein [Actinomycetospora endophytica]